MVREVPGWPQELELRLDELPTSELGRGVVLFERLLEDALDAMDVDEIEAESAMARGIESRRAVTFSEP